MRTRLRRFCGRPVQWTVAVSVRRSAGDQRLKYGSCVTSGTAGGRLGAPGAGPAAWEYGSMEVWVSDRAELTHTPRPEGTPPHTHSALTASAGSKGRERRGSRVISEFSRRGA